MPPNTHAPFTLSDSYVIMHKYHNEQKDDEMEQCGRFAERAKEIHGEQYDYSKVKYINSRTKVEIICPKHGSFFQTPANHIQGSGCKKCSYESQKKTRSRSQEEFITLIKETHGNRYDYSLAVYDGDKKKVTLTCLEHNIQFKQRASSVINGLDGCPECRKTKYGKHLRSSTEDFIKKATEVHGERYDYSNAVYQTNSNDIEIRCPKHGIFFQTPANHLQGQGCSACNREEREKRLQESFISHVASTHQQKYSYENISSYDAREKVEIICPEHGSFFQTPSNHRKGSGCPICANIGPSKGEDEVVEFIQSICDFDIERSSRNVIPPYELDIYIPSHNIAIEFNGVYWHSEVYRSSDYHQKKSLLCMEKGVQLIHIWEDNWNSESKREVIKKKIKAKLGVSVERVFARKCKIVIPDPTEVRSLVESNHIQGFTGASIWIGLEYDKELIACIGMKRTEDAGVWDLIRYSTSKQVIGGFSRLLSYFKRNYAWSMVFTYAHLDYSHGNLYEQTGFTKKHITPPGMYYAKNRIRHRREKFMKHKLKNKLEVFYPEKTERENMNMNGFVRIYDSGNIRYELHNI